MNRSNLKRRSLLLMLILVSGLVVQSANRYWVFQNFYDNDFSSAPKLADWTLVEDDGTGGFSASGHGTAILTMDDAAGGFANRLFNVNGGVPRFVPLDKVFGEVNLNVIATTGGNQLFFLQAQEFDASNNYLGQVDILPAQNTTGFFNVDLSSIAWDPSAVSIRFIIGGENFSAQQGTVEFGYFSYSTQNNSWNNAANWSVSSGGAGGASVPGPSDIAVLDGAGGSNGGALIDADISVGGVQITSGYLNNIDLQGFKLSAGSAGVNIAGGGISQGTNSINIAGDLSVSGGVFTNLSGTDFIQGNVLITGGSVNPATVTLDMNGTTDQSIFFAVGLNIHQLILDKPGGNLNLNSSLSVADFLTLNQGLINTNGFTLTLGFNAAFPGFLNYTAGKINGMFSRWVSASATGNLLFPMGNAVANAPFNINVLTAPASGGTVTVQYNDAAPGFTAASFLDNGIPIMAISTASWTVQDAGLSAGNFSLSASTDHVTGIADFSILHMTLMNGAVGTHQAAAGSNTDPVVNRTAIDASTLAQTFFIGAPSTALPVKFDNFTATNTATGVEWLWSVRDEENLSYYEPQYATDQKTFVPAGKVMATNQAHVQDYSFVKPLPVTRKIYCRLKAVDLDGKYYYSRVVEIFSTPVAGFLVWPNPASVFIYAQAPVMVNGTSTILLLNSLGRVCLESNISNGLIGKIDIRALPAGMYYVQLLDASGNINAARQIIIVH